MAFRIKSTSFLVSLFAVLPFWVLNVNASERMDRVSILVAIQKLKSLPTGAKIVKRMLGAWGLQRVEDIANKVSLGSLSRTDTTLTRTFNLDTGREEREREILISIRANQGFDDLVLDLAHELVHASSRPVFDPYDPRLTAGKYILNGIEGLGGEVDAVEEECFIAREMTVGGVSVERCQKYFGREFSTVGDAGDRDADARMRIKKGFYQVGSWMSHLERELGAEKKLFPLLTARSPELLSSTGRSPYPVALFEEYRSITKIACENMTRRLRSVFPGYSPGGFGKTFDLIFRREQPESAHVAPSDYVKSIENFLENRCQERSSESFQ